MSRSRRRSPLLLRLIAAERAIRGVILIAAGAYLFGHLHSDLGKLADRWMRRVELDPNRHFLRRIVEHLHHVTTNEVKIFAFLAVAYGVLELVEGVGLWRGKKWAEYLTIGVTASLLPVEVMALVHRITLVRVATLVINALVIVYLLWELRARTAKEHRAALGPSAAG